jgi:hypothetical protein
MTEPQYMTALATANATRKARSGLHHQVHDIGSFDASCMELADILAGGVPACMASMRVEEALRWLWLHGRSKDGVVDEVLDLVGCSEFKLVGELSVRQRSVIVNVLRAWAYERRAAA